MSGVDSFRIKDAYHRMLEIDPFVPKLVNGNDEIMYRTYHSTSDKYELKWKYLKGERLNRYLLRYYLMIRRVSFM